MFGYVKIEALNNCKKELAETKAKLESKESYILGMEEVHTELIERFQQLEQELVDSKATTLPDSRFNIGKAVTLLTTKLSDKALAKFCFEFVAELDKSKQSHLTSLNNYTLRALSK